MRGLAAGADFAVFIGPFNLGAEAYKK